MLSVIIISGYVYTRVHLYTLVICTDGVTMDLCHCLLLVVFGLYSSIIFHSVLDVKSLPAYKPRVICHIQVCVKYNHLDTVHKSSAINKDHQYLYLFLWLQVWLTLY